MAGHREDVEGAVELAHGFVEERGDDASVNVARGTFVHLVELEVAGGGDGFGVYGVCGEGEVEALWVSGAAAEAVVGTLVDGGVAIHGDGIVSGLVEDFGVEFGFGHGLISSSYSDANTRDDRMNSHSVFMIAQD